MGVFILEKDITFMFIRRNFDMQFRVHADKMLLYFSNKCTWSFIYIYLSIDYIDELNGFVNSFHLKHIMGRNAMLLKIFGRGIVFKLFDTKMTFDYSC